jgi:cell division protein FtsI (penicillin-binding protein 3)
MLLVLGAAFGAILSKLVVLQGIDSSAYLATSQGSEWRETLTLTGERGAILDRNGYELAMSIPQTTIYADPRDVTDPVGEAAALAPVLSVNASKVLAEMSEPTTFVYLARTVSDAVAAKVAALDLPGIYALQEPKRFYPAGQLAQPLLGSVGIDGEGLGALEYQYNSLLKGRSGRLVQEIDPEGRPIPDGREVYVAPVAGQDLVLTLDEPLQYEAEQALAQAIVGARAHSGIAILMNTKTGDILADAELSMPSTGNTSPPAVPLQIRAVGDTSPSNPQPVEAPNASSLTQVYEPGSVNKLITISAALQTGAVKPSDMFWIPNSYVVSDGVFHDAESHPLEHWSVTDILANSSNIGTIQIGQRLGKDNLLKYIRDFGFGSPTGLHFPGESSGLLPSYWSGTSIATVPIGQGIAVTALQMIAAYNTIANGGVYVPPRLVDGTIDSQGKEHVTPSAPTHRVVSPTVASQMTTMLDEVVRVGTGRAANLNPYTVAGKTGTGTLVENGRYQPGHYVASFAGFVPAEAPQITAMVVIDNTPYFAAAAAAPTFASIARDALRELQIPPMPKEAPAPGVPLSTTQSATGAGDLPGNPLPTLITSPTVPAPVVAPKHAPSRGGTPKTPATRGHRSSNPSKTTATTRPSSGAASRTPPSTPTLPSTSAPPTTLPSRPRSPVGTG